MMEPSPLTVILQKHPKTSQWHVKGMLVSTRHLRRCEANTSHTQGGQNPFNNGVQSAGINSLKSKSRNLEM